MPRARALYARARKAKHLPACQSLGELHLDLDVAARNPRKGARLLLRACEGNRYEVCEGLITVKGLVEKTW